MEKNALITGAGRRIGRAIAIKLAKQGWNIALHHNKSAEAAEELAAGISAMGRKTVLVSGDLAHADDITQIFEAAHADLGPLSCLINNASLFEPDTLASVTTESFQSHLSVNLMAPVLLMSAFSKQNLDGQGNIINIIDQRVANLRPGFLSYTLSKSALWTLTQSAAMELAPKIRVNAIAPGPTLANKRQSAAQFKQQCQSVPLQYGPTENEIAEGVSFLLGARSMTGEMIMMDGGEHLSSSQAVEE
ncbi:MAG: SDR family oxidoreductase [Sneathiella sp.]